MRAVMKMLSNHKPLIQNITLNQGFTLIEVMVALLIFAIMSSVALIGLVSVLDTRNATDYRSARLAELQRAFIIIGRDFEQTINRPIINSYQEERLGFESLAGGEFIVEFTRGGWRNPLNLEDRSTLQRVAYAWVNDELQRVTWRVLDQASDAMPSIRTVLSGVNNIFVRYLDMDGQFYAIWPPETMQTNMNENVNTAEVEAGTETENANVVISYPLPIAVELTLDIVGQGTIRRVFRLPGD